MRARGLPVAIILLVALLASGAAVRYFERPWAQLVGDNVIRTNAPAELLADAQHEVIARHQNRVANPGGSRSDPTLSSAGSSYKAGPAPDRIETEVTRGKTEVTDARGRRLTIERITSYDSPTLLFVEYDRPAGARSIALQLLHGLHARGVGVRY